MPQITLARAGQISDPVEVGPGTRITAVGGYVQWTSGTLTDVRNGVAVWQNWPIGAVAGYQDTLRRLVVRGGATAAMTLTWDESRQDEGPEGAYWQEQVPAWATDEQGNNAGLLLNGFVRTNVIPMSPADPATQFPRSQPYAPELLATFGRASMVDGTPLNPQPLLIGSRQFTPVGSPRLTHSATGWGHGGMAMLAASAQYLECTDAAWNPFPADGAWSFQIVFSYPSSLRSGGATDYTLVNTQQGSGNFRGLNLRLAWNGSAMLLVGDLYNTASQRWRLNDGGTDIAADVPHVVTVRKQASATDPTGLQLFLDTKITAHSQGSWGAGSGTLGTTDSGIPLRLGLRATGSTIPFTGTIEAFAYWPAFIPSVHNVIYSHYRWLNPTNNVILSTDATGDVDDAVTDIDKLAGASARGMINLAAVICDSADDDSPGATRAVLNYRGVRPRLGAWPGTRSVDSAPNRWTDEVRAGFPVPAEVTPFAAGASARTQFETSLVALVGTLVRMRPGSTTVFLVGYPTAWSDLLDADATAIGTAATSAGVPNPSLTGINLVLSRVARVVICGGHYPDSRQVPGSRLDVNLNSPEYNFQADPTRWQNIVSKMPAGVRLDWVSMADAVGVLTSGVAGWDKARLTASGASSPVPLVRALAAKVGTLDDAGERESYDGFAIADLLWPGAIGHWQPMRDVVIENDGHNTAGTTTAQQARYLVPDTLQAAAVRAQLMAL